jgi:hypothetical protein
MATSVKAIKAKWGADLRNNRGIFLFDMQGTYWLVIWSVTRATALAATATVVLPNLVPRFGVVARWNVGECDAPWLSVSA